MSLVQTYLENNGYDCDGNTAEDTLVFIVQNEAIPLAEKPEDKSSEVITNTSADAVNGIPAEGAAI